MKIATHLHRNIPYKIQLISSQYTNLIVNLWLINLKIAIFPSPLNKEDAKYIEHSIADVNSFSPFKAQGSLSKLD